ncbi:MAG: hypothetical protein AMXMBFR44_5080 [Candidatus Campbellbacteria bacterium]
MVIRSDTTGFAYFDDVELVSETVPLLWPLEGGYPGGTILSPFGDDWVRSCNGLIKKHAGVDVAASVGTEVRSAMTGTVRHVFTDTENGWGQAVVVEDVTGSFTVVYWHVDASVSEDDVVNRGDTIGTVANISPTTSHLHFGYRQGSYHSANSLAGSLPQTVCGEYPAFPENFVNPANFSFASW